MTENRKIVVVTGCLGFIGQWVTRSLLERGWRVCGVDKRTYAADPQPCFDLQDPNFKLIEEDICDLTSLPDCDYVINLAAESHVGNSIMSSRVFTNTNVEGVRNLLDLVRDKPTNAYGRPRFIHFSTDEVYGDRKTGAFVETDILNPSNPYSASKAAADMLIGAWARTYGIEYNIVRPTNNYGLGQYPEKLIPLSVKALQAGKKIALHNHGEPTRSWLHVEDTASAVLCILDKAPANEIYNIGGFEQKNKHVVHKLINCYFEKDVVDISNFVDLSYERQGQDVRYSVDDSKLKNLGWQPYKFFDEELPWIILHYKRNFRW